MTTPIPKVMGVLNITPDSFYDGGRWLDKNAALVHVLDMVAEGADIIDIGGESTRPGAMPVSLDEELNRVIPIIECLAAEIDVPLAIDTYKPKVMTEAINAGATMINDVKALSEPGAVQAATASGVKVSLMHMRGEPTTMQCSPYYRRDIVTEIHDFFTDRIKHCWQAGLNASQIIIDPGFGFGKTTAHNLKLINQLERFSDLGVAIMVGVSRKHSIGDILKVPVTERLTGSLALATLAIYNGAQYIRAHDVKATVQAVTMAWAVRNEGNN